MKFSTPSFLFSKLILLTFVLLVSFTFIGVASAASGFGYDNSYLPNIPEEDEVTIITITNFLNKTKSSNYWDDMDTINETQMEDNSGVLNKNI